MEWKGYEAVMAQHLHDQMTDQPIPLGLRIFDAEIGGVFPGGMIYVGTDGVISANDLAAQLAVRGNTYLAQFPGNRAQIYSHTDNGAIVASLAAADRVLRTVPASVRMAFARDVQQIVRQHQSADHDGRLLVVNGYQEFLRVIDRAERPMAIAMHAHLLQRLASDLRVAVIIVGQHDGISLRAIHPAEPYRGTGPIENHAHAVVWLNRSERAGAVDVAVVKNRYGPAQRVLQAMCVLDDGILRDTTA